jgi:high-affinity nickel-transport protein
MIGLASALGIGALLGLKHATDADHVVAVTAIVARERSVARAARIGVLWGIGHSLTVFVLGGIIIAFRLTVPPRLGLALELGVALMLVLLGFANLRRPRGGEAAGHGHPHPPAGSRAGLRPVAVGVVHGVAGSAAVAILVLTTIQDTAWALAYLLVFGAGTIGGMLAVTMLLAVPTVLAAQRMVRMQRGIRMAAGALSVVFGVLLAWEIIVEGGLFSATPTWDPH